MIIAAVGSSFASGAGLPPYSDLRALRSANNYPSRVATGHTLVDLTRSGATTGDVIADQIPRIPAGAATVTVTVGGNDVRFIKTALLWSLAGRPSLRPLRGVLRRRAGTPPTPAEAAQVVTAGLTAVCTAISDRAPGAQIILADYATVIGDRARAGHGHLSGPQIAALRGIEQAIARAHRAAAQATGATLIRISEATEDHGLGSAEPWVTMPRRLWQVPRRLPFHPAGDAVRVYAEEIIAVLTCESGTDP